ncbi:cytochrome-c peroxidase [Adhaeribacter swui]|uniref:Cytochrome-c peroxidase n=1 Tax=Adhaeribacter swui TaxID=2086471 RepID=A0A7G7G7E8_9BACT|nr:cytochrome c peroxidase [Adhaeribacter swui]QNF33082.1 cytochrome-c peroxidase [Adhaeribacter swui]
MKRLFKIAAKSKLRHKRAGILLLLVPLLVGWIANAPPAHPYLFEFPTNFGQRFTIPADNPTTQAGVALGRYLFYETKLSANNQLSCGSCHQQQRAFTDGKAFSTGVDQKSTSRNSMALVNLLWNRKFFWDGRSASLEDQALFPLTNPHEMGQPLAVSVHQLRKTPLYPPLFKAAFGDTAITAKRLLQALAQFERTLISANSRYDQYLRGQYQPTSLELQGLALFTNGPQPEKNSRGANCAHCHGGVKTYLDVFHNNGLNSIYSDTGRQSITGSLADHGRFKVPTLRNIALTAPYMHDGRFQTLEEVLAHYNGPLRAANLSPFLKDVSNDPHGPTLALTATEKQAIIAFLHLLTDSSFVQNPAFADPFPSLPVSQN